ncbi:MAG: ankyrin repeat protein [Salibacteraceae bacterium]|jgi:ankyrin repeat protein
MRKFVILLAILPLCNFILGQSKNVFLDRIYWKNNPSIEQIKKDINSGNDIAALNAHKFDGVVWAILEKVDNSVIQYLLEKDGNGANKITHDGRTYIFWAAYKNNLTLMEHLLKKGAKTDIIDAHGYSIMNFAAVTGQTNPALYDFCIRNGADVLKEKSNVGASPLILLMPHLESTEFITYFTDKGLSIRDVDNNGNNAFVYASQLGNLAVLEYLIKQGINPNANNDYAMIHASQGGRNKVNDLEVFQFLKNAGVSPLAISKEGQNALHSIAKTSDLTEVVDFFIAQNIDLNKADEKGKTPLVNAIESNNLEMIMYFISKGTDPEIVLKNGNTILHVAIQRGDEKILEYVSSLVNDLNIKNNNGLSPLHFAAMNSSNDILLKLLISIGADKTLKTEFGETAFDLASENELLASANVNLTFLK